MATFKYVGDPDNDGDGPETLTCFGVEFTKGEPTEVSDKTAIAKLGANSHFESVDGRTKEAKKAKAKPAEDAE